MKCSSRSHRLPWICAALLAFTGLVTGQEEPTTRRVTATDAKVQINQIETSQFPKVVIFATVIKDGEPVLGLTDKDFRVREDEVDQEPLTVEPKLTPLSVSLTLDTSGSMKKRLSDAQKAAKGFLDMLEAQDEVQVIRFSRDVKTISPLGPDRRGAEAAIDRTVARGDTALWDALYASVESLRDVAGRKAIVLLSDGVDDDGTGKPLSKHSVDDVLVLARQVNVPIYAIGLGTELDELALKTVAAETGAFYLNAVEASELARLYDNIGKQLAGQYTISYTSNLPADGAEHSVQLRVKKSISTKTFLPPVAVEPGKTKREIVDVPKPEVPEPPKKRVVKIEKPQTGTIVVVNTKDHVNIINQESGEKAGFCGTACTTGKRPVQVPAGTYKLKFPNFTVDDIKVADAQDVVIDASTLVGWISVRNTKDHVNIINQESGEKAGFCGTACTTGKRPVQVPAGTYKLKFPNFEVDDIQVKAGEEVVVE
jgi:Ca-activated chloride channel family protein